MEQLDDMGHCANRFPVILPVNNILRSIRLFAPYALAHTVENKVEAAYRRGDLLTKRREMMQEWANYLYLRKADAEIIPITQHT